ncbi:MAG TPA: pyridoxamine 5'-phosphate oxidase family protein [Thermodesulfobacteriota bacterium]|nr:pyridoxamine 5'-phosphate oxidase family protein [Deltaproteobacteria bacterium]HNU72188.1 pyridoxamine 5'-phosphate oxidase family protein [Thermodesulfobacteriota bacterium]HOC38331.1 pyridoxamine 5'-phosphate oxidase family protein [Thermodesulfobacteriota bacterium]HQO78193.1 pyridoxamine 5'-phosphate oxidase family protein [Thermodesulfobacteriota bacterium]
MSDIRQRIFTLLQEPQLASFATTTEKGSPWVRYVIAHAARDLSIRFATSRESRKVAQIQNNPDVHITAGVADPTSAKSYVQIEGTAKFVTDQTERDAFWHENLKNYFSGPQDPHYGVVVVQPRRIELYTMGKHEPEVWERK